MMRQLKAGLPLEAGFGSGHEPGELRGIDQLRSLLEVAIADALDREHTVLVFRVQHESFASSDDVDFFQYLPLHPALKERLEAVAVDIQVIGSAAGGLIGFIPDLRRRTDGEDLLNLITAELARPITIDGLPVLLGAHTGGAILSNDNTTVDDLFEASKLALCEADASRVAVMFHPYQRVRDTRASDLARDFRTALINRDLTVAYQPVVNLQSGAIAGIKAYVVWDRQGALVPSNEVVEIAERWALSVPVGQHVLGESFAAVAGWVRVGLIESTTLWLQVHPREVLNPGFAPGVTQAIKFDPRVQVGIELTENPSENQPYTHSTIRSLVAQGARASLGDLGKGPLDLAEAQQMPFTAGRVNSTLTRQLGSSGAALPILKLLLELAQVLSWETTVEGIDTADQLEAALAAGASFGQGNYFSSPLLAGDMIQLLQEAKSGRSLL